MTCIVALKIPGGGVLMGADSAGVGGYSMQRRTDPKIYRFDAMLIGFTTSFRMGQLLGHSLLIPEQAAGLTNFRFMTTSFVDAVRTCLKNGGFAKKENEVEQGGTFMVAYRGDIFTVHDDYQVGQVAEDFAAIGSGFDVALGSLATSESLIEDPQTRIKIALKSAERFSGGVRAPFLIERL